ncbi:MAG: hypothetical protein JKY92_04170 [Magnetovibrio sp.]|nr:hypothetical protein [Magnetovibrio sp.]
MASDFTKFEAFRRVTGTYKLYQLEADMVWEIGAKGSGWKLIVPAALARGSSSSRAWALFIATLAYTAISHRG